MVVIYILLGLLALVALVLFCSLSLTVDFSEKLTVTARFWGLKYDLTEQKEKKTLKTDKKKAQPKEQSAFLGQMKKNSFLENVKFIIGLLREIMPQLKYVLSHLRVRDFALDIRVANPDAAKTALEYGAVCSAVYPFLSWADRLIDLSMKKVDITAAFGEEKCSARLHLKIKLRVIILLIAMFKLLPIYLKLTEDANNERKKHRFNN